MSVSPRNTDAGPFHQGPGQQNSSLDTVQLAQAPASSLYFDADTIAQFEQLFNYPFDNDQEYQVGLAAIFGHPGTPATREEVENNQELVLQAQCFYYARRSSTEPIQPSIYQIWLDRRASPVHDKEQSFKRTTATSNGTTQGEKPKNLDDTERALGPPVRPSVHDLPSEQPPYPTSFADIVDMITQNKPIPGIEDVPDTVLEPGTSKVDNTQRRRKPWESVEGPDRKEDRTPAGQKKDQGVLKILQPGAIPDSGLLSKE